ncbi:MAG: acyl dehydratase [Paracoccaceae bacterium]
MTKDETDNVLQFDQLDPARGMALWAALGSAKTLKKDDHLPPFFHQIYFWTALEPQNLGRDGHPKRGIGVVPDLGLPRRMWAGGRLTFQRPLLAGRLAQCTTQCLSVTQKTGRTGPLGLVTLGLSYKQSAQLCVHEERDLIYRTDPDPESPKTIPPTVTLTARITRSLSFDTTILFRYSALTFNGHRIHYDLDYAKDIEGYEGLVVHGPLLAQILVLFAEEQLGPIRSFQFRATAPLLHFENAEVCLSGQDLWIRGPDNRLCMQATVTL